MSIFTKALTTVALATALMSSTAMAENVKIAIVVKALGIGFFEAAAKGACILLAFTCFTRFTRHTASVTR